MELTLKQKNKICLNVVRSAEASKSSIVKTTGVANEDNVYTFIYDGYKYLSYSSSLEIVSISINDVVVRINIEEAPVVGKVHKKMILMFEEQKKEEEASLIEYFCRYVH